jgi:hypothetical protein
MITSYLNTAKNYVADHKLDILTAAAVITVFAAMKTGLNQHDQFLKDHGLYEEFYKSDDE